MSQDPALGAAKVTVGAQETTVTKTVARYSYERSVYQVHQEFSELNPRQISEACTAWKRTADHLYELAEVLKAQIAIPLDLAWSSPASPAAQVQLRQAEATTRALANDCMQMAHATDYAAKYADWYARTLPSYGDAVGSSVKATLTGGPSGMAAGASTAVEHMTSLLGRYNEVIEILPSSVRTQLATVDPSQAGMQIDGGGSGAPAGATFVGGPGKGWTAAATAPSTFGSDSQGGIGGLSSGLLGGEGATGDGADPYAAGSSLAGTGLGGGLSSFDPRALGAGIGGSVGLGSGLGSGAVGAAGLGAGGLGAGPGVVRGWAGLGSVAGGAGMEGPVRSPGPAGTGAAGVGGSGMMPVQGAAGQGEGEQERERSWWLTEDASVWVDDGDVSPPVITS